MSGTLKEISENYEKLHRLQMIQVILRASSSYVTDVVSRVENDFDDCEDFEDEITKTVIARIVQDLDVLEEYL